MRAAGRKGGTECWDSEFAAFDAGVPGSDTGLRTHTKTPATGRPPPHRPRLRPRLLLLTGTPPIVIMAMGSSWKLRSTDKTMANLSCRLLFFNFKL